MKRIALAFIFALAGTIALGSEGLAWAADQAKEIARDGEGATKLIEVTVTGAFNDTEARRAARTIAWP